MRGAELLGQEARYRWLVGTAGRCPRLFGHESRQECRRSRHLHPRQLQPGGHDDAFEQFPNRTRFTVRDHECSTGERRGTVECRNQRTGGIVEVGRVDQGSPRADDCEAAAPSTIHDAANELRVTRPPDQMGADGNDREVRSHGSQRNSFGHCLGGRVVAACDPRIRSVGTGPDEGSSAVRDGGRGDMDESGDAGRSCRSQDPTGSHDVDPFEFAPRTDYVDLGRHVDDSLLPGNSTAERHLVRDVTEHLDNTRGWVTGPTLHRGDGIPPGNQAFDGRPGDEAGTTGDQDPHSPRIRPPAAMSRTQEATQERSILEL